MTQRLAQQLRSVAIALAAEGEGVQPSKDAAVINAAADEIDALLTELRQVTMLFKSALFCTTVEIAREARPFIDSAEAVIAKAAGEQPKKRRAS